MFNHLAPKTQDEMEANIDEMLKKKWDYNFGEHNIDHFLNNPYFKIYSNAEAIFSIMKINVHKTIKLQATHAIYCSNSFAQAKKKVKSLVYWNGVRVRSILAVMLLLVATMVIKYVFKKEELYETINYAYWASLLSFWIAAIKIISIGNKRKNDKKLNKTFV